MTGLRYPQNAIYADYARAGAGLVVSIGLLVFTDLLPIVFYIALGLTLLFAVFAWRTLLRQFSLVIVDDQGIRLQSSLHRSFDRQLPWQRLSDLKVRYFSTKRDRSDGWMQIVLKGDGTRIQLDSSLDGFEDIVARAAGEARERDLELGPTTLTNLRAMGLAPEEDGA